MPMYRVRTVFTGVPGTPYYSNLYFTQEGGTVAQARAAVNTFWEANKALITVNLKWSIELEVPIIDEVTGDVISVAAGTTTYTSQGTRTETPIPYSNQVLCRLRTGVFNGGREIRGRIFIPGFTQISQNSDGVVGTAAAGVATNLAAMINSADAQLVVWAKSKGAYAVVNSGSVWNQFAVLRSRRD